MKQTKFKISKMDCPSEERLIRMALEGDDAVRGMTFDLAGRSLTVVHTNPPEVILSKLAPLNFGALIENTSIYLASDDQAPNKNASTEHNEKESRVLVYLLAINGIMFVFEIVLGFAAGSTGLIADSLDMFADAAVYGLSLYAVGRAISHKRRAARMSGYIQLALAVMALGEVVRHFIRGSEPVAPLMMGVAAVALIANVTCLWLISDHREGGVHMKASWIFSTNDVVANLGVIAAGGLVYLFNSQLPDLVVGLIIACVVFRGALAILKLSRPQVE